MPPRCTARLAARLLRAAARPNHTLTLKWKDSSGALKETASVPTGGGNPDYCSTDNVVAVGDKIKIIDGQSSHKLTVPKLYGSIDRVSDDMSGTGPRGKTLKILCNGSPFGQFEPCQYTKKVTVNSSGHWSAHIPFDLYGGFTMYVVWKNDYGDKVNVRVTAPYFQVLLDKSRFFGVTQPLSTGTVTLEDSTHAAKGSGSGESGPLDGSFTGQLRDDQGDLVNVAPGDLASSDVASDASFVVPQIEAMATASDNHVWGHCEATDSFAGVYVELYRNGEIIGSSANAQNDEETVGDFNIPDFENTFARPADIEAGDKLHITCLQGAGLDWATKVIVAQ